MYNGCRNFIFETKHQKPINKKYRPNTISYRIDMHCFLVRCLLIGRRYVDFNDDIGDDNDDDQD